MSYESNAGIHKFKIVCKSCLCTKVDILKIEKDFIKVICSNDKCKSEDYISIK